MASWEAPFVSLLQPTTSKTSTTQQRCLCPAHQDSGEFLTPMHLKVDDRTHGEGRPQQCSAPFAPDTATPMATELGSGRGRAQIVWALVLQASAAPDNPVPHPWRRHLQPQVPLSPTTHPVVKCLTPVTPCMAEDTAIPCPQQQCQWQQWH